MVSLPMVISGGGTLLVEEDDALQKCIRERGKKSGETTGP